MSALFEVMLAGEVDNSIPDQVVFGVEVQIEIQQFNQVNKSTKTEWKQKFLPHGQTRDCIHGSLARSCRVCSLEHEVHDLEEESAALREKVEAQKKQLEKVGVLLEKIAAWLSKATIV